MGYTRTTRLSSDLLMNGNIDMQDNLLKWSLGAGSLKIASNHFQPRNLTDTGTIQSDLGSVVLYGNLYLGSNKIGRTITAETLGAGATTFVAVSDVMEITGDGGGNTIATITGGYNGQKLLLIFVDANVTISNDDTHAANTVDLEGAGDFTSADDKILELLFDGTSWYALNWHAD